MDFRKEHDGWLTFLENWGLLLSGITAFLVWLVFDFLIRLFSLLWLGVFVVSFAVMILGAGLIVYAKIPAYRSGRVLTFGLKSVPEHLAGHYRRGWQMFLFGVVLSLGLLLSKP